MNFSRKTILVVGAALLAACGDKVTVQEYTPPVTTAKVNFVEVTPATATVSTGQSITFTAAVNADAGLATTVTWSASAGTITSAGVFTAPSTGNPGISVCATSTVDTGKKGCATVVVTAAPATIPASISISSITVGGVGAGLNVPVNPAAVAGQIDIRLNVNPGNQTVSKVVLLVGGIRADSQTFTAAQAAALRYSADEAVAAQSTFPQIVFSVNTAAFNATTGIPTWANGSRSISAQLYTTQSGTATAATASVATSLTFANADTYTLSLGAAAATANSTPGYAYRRGDLVVSVLPVIYNTGRAIGTATLTFGTVGCDNTIPAANRARALTAPAAGSSLWTTTFSATDANGPLASNVTGYEFNAGACNPAIGEGFSLTAADANGNTMLTAVAPANAPVVRLDNLAPPVVALVGGAILTPGTRTGGWVNDAVKFTATVAADAANGSIVAAVADGGVGGVNYRASVGGVNYTTPVGLAESSAPNNYTISVYSRDALGNESLNTDATFAVDRTAPVYTLNNTIGTGSHYNATTNPLPATFAASTVVDPATGSALASGFVGLAGTPISLSITRRNASNSKFYCPDALVLDYQDAATACASWAAGTVNFASAIDPATIVGTANAGEGYYTTTGTVADQAGNTSAVATVVFAYDNTAPVASVLAPLTWPVDGSGVTLTGSMADALDIRGYMADYVVGAGAFVPLGGVAATAGETDRFFPAVPTTTSSFNPTAFTTSGTFSVSIPRLPVQWQTSDGAFTAPATFSTISAITNTASANVRVVNSGAVASPAATAPVAFTAFASPWTTGTFSWIAPVMQTTSFSGTSNISRDGGCGSTTLGYGTTRIASIDAIGPTGAGFVNPFTRVQFYAYQGTGTTMTSLSPSLTSLNKYASQNGWRLLGEVGQATVLDNGINRTWRFQLTFDPSSDQLPWYSNSSCGTASTFRIVAVGLNGGSALVSPQSGALNVWR